MKHIPTLSIVAFLLGGMVLGQKAIEWPDDKQETVPLSATHRSSPLEKTESVFQVENNHLFRQIEGLSRTKPFAVPGTGIGVGGPIGVCEIWQKNAPAAGKFPERKWYSVTVFESSLIQLVEVTVDGFTSHHRLLGWFLVPATWKQLMEEMLRQSEEIRKERSNKHQE